MSNAKPAEHLTNIQTEQLLRQMNDEFVKAIVRRDAETLQRIMAEDFFFAYPLEGDDRTQFISDITGGDLIVEHITRHQLSVRIFGSAAVYRGFEVETFDAAVSRGPPGKDQEN